MVSPAILAPTSAYAVASGLLAILTLPWCEARASAGLPNDKIKPRGRVERAEPGRRAIEEQVMRPLHSLPERGATPNRSAGSGQNAEEVRAARHRKKLARLGQPRPDHSRERFSLVARATQTARPTGVAVLRDPTDGSLQAHRIDRNAEEGELCAARRRSGTIAPARGGPNVGVCHG
jgi:hypothetical protein